MWDQARGYDLAEIGMREESGDHVREQPDGQPLEDFEDELVGEEHLERQDQERRRQDEPQLLHGASGEERATCRDRAKVGAGIDRVGDE